MVIVYLLSFGWYVLDLLSQTALENSGYAGKGNIRFVTSEQHFVWLKAKLFGDTIIMEKVLSV